MLEEIPEIVDKLLIVISNKHNNEQARKTAEDTLRNQYLHINYVQQYFKRKETLDRIIKFKKKTEEHGRSKK